MITLLPFWNEKKKKELVASQPAAQLLTVIEDENSPGPELPNVRIKIRIFRFGISSQGRRKRTFQLLHEVSKMGAFPIAILFKRSLTTTDCMHLHSGIKKKKKEKTKTKMRNPNITLCKLPSLWKSKHSSLYLNTEEKALLTWYIRVGSETLNWFAGTPENWKKQVGVPSVPAQSAPLWIFPRAKRALTWASSCYWHSCVSLLPLVLRMAPPLSTHKQEGKFRKQEIGAFVQALTWSSRHFLIIPCNAIFQKVWQLHRWCRKWEPWVTFWPCWHSVTPPPKKNNYGKSSHFGIT